MMQSVVSEIDEGGVAGPTNPPTDLPSPLEQLLATASGNVAVLPLAPNHVLPLAPNHFRPKRKPQRFRPAGGVDRPRFKPRKRVQELAPDVTSQEEEEEETNQIATTERPVSFRKKFGGFSRRPRPTSPRLRPVEQETTAYFEPTTPPPKFQLEDFFGTPEPAIVPATAAQPTLIAQPDPQLNTIDDNSILDEVRARTVAITGAQAVGVTKDVTQHRLQGARQLSLRKENTRKDSHQGGARNEGRRGGRPRQQQPARQEASQPEAAAAPRDRRVEVEDRRLKNEVRRFEEQVERRNKEQEQGGRRVQGGRRRNNHNVGTVENYRFKNEDGSITWGYENEDGSYKEEKIGVDCITRGKYGYIDPTGEVREYSYTSGNRCDPETRKVAKQENGGRGANGNGFYDYARNNFVMPDGRRVRVVVNPGNKARGRRY